MKTEKILLILVVVFTFSRILFLDADPSLFKNVGDVQDEGFWGYEARNKALFGEWITDEFTQSTATAPLYTFLSFVAFKSFGVHLFTARLVPAVAGILSIFILYFTVRRYDKRLAAVTAFILAINNAFFMYNRVGHPESVVIFFLLLNFFFLTSKTSSKTHYLMAGTCFMLAVLSKITAIYFSIAIFFYFVALYLRKEVNFKDIFTYFIGFLLVATPTLFFYYIPLFPVFKSTLSGFSGGGPLIIILAPLRLYYFASNYYFSLPSVFLLLILSLIYFKERKILTFFADIRQNIKSLDVIELMAVTWFFGYLIGLLFSDFSSRRFTILIIPLVLFSSMLINKRAKDNFTGQKHLSPLTFAILLVPFLNLLNYRMPALSKYVGSRPELTSTLPSTMFAITGPIPTTTFTRLLLMAAFLLIAIISTALYAVLLRHNSGYKNTIHKYLPSLSLLSLFLALSLNFVGTNARLIEFFYTSIPEHSTVLASLLLSALLFLSIRTYTSLLAKVSSRTYIVFCIFAIFCTLLFPSFSTKNPSAEISKACNGGEWIIGPLGHELSFENELRPLWWVPNIEKYKPINRDVVEKYKPRCYIKVVSWDGKKTNLGNIWPMPRQVNKPLVYLNTFELWPVFGKPRAVFELYRINYKRERER